MASRYRSLSNPTFNLLKSTLSPKSTPKVLPFIRVSLSSPSIPRSFAPLSALQSLLPLHSAVSSARLTSCLGIDSTSSRSLSQAGPDLWFEGVEGARNGAKRPPDIRRYLRECRGFT